MNLGWAKFSIFFLLLQAQPLLALSLLPALPLPTKKMEKKRNECK
jgi:hypothetical protein